MFFYIRIRAVSYGRNIVGGSAVGKAMADEGGASNMPFYETNPFANASANDVSSYEHL